MVVGSEVGHAENGVEGPIWRVDGSEVLPVGACTVADSPSL